ncbi:hypothetical protein [Mesorhizobium sp.]|uniref:hypothetical protein n=2 Tax=Mesorhizobium TaxID=68287 RepID=UPI000FE36241|nr:hypothetical protein [Mesorhizobium sp.]RWG89444.1 MAG: hypothetical protein EOQ70_07985 [Mesorhizobium sp.]RWK20541.1 MAG: hypothetical protein EOR41_07300 [Mesorhizobium sp.]
MNFVELPGPVGPGEVLVEAADADANFMDTGVRRGLAWTDIPNPKVPGVEGDGGSIQVGDQARRQHARWRGKWRLQDNLEGNGAP